MTGLALALVSYDRSMNAPTQEEVMRVRRYECHVNGHRWSAINVAELEDPVRFVCSRCGRSVTVVADDVEMVS